MASAAALRDATLELFRRVHRGRKAVTFREAVKPATKALATWSAREAAFLEWFAVWSEVLHQNGIEPEPRVAERVAHEQRPDDERHRRDRDRAAPTTTSYASRRMPMDASRSRG